MILLKGFGTMILGYGAASAAVVQKKFICNIVFLIVIAVAANIVGKMKKK